jgi:hypothetical protein
MGLTLQDEEKLQARGNVVERSFLHTIVDFSMRARSHSWSWSLSPVLMGLGLLLLGFQNPLSAFGADRAGEDYAEKIQPILEEYCYGCHANGLKKGGVTFDGPTAGGTQLNDREFWWPVLKNVRSGIMPPAGKPKPTDEERKILEDWIKFGPLGIDPKNPDPGRVTVRRLNRVEYRNTIRDLMGVDYDTTSEFPADDTGHGFDNIGDVLTMSPLLLEKYLVAAQAVVSKAVPTTSRAVTERAIPGRRFHPAAETPTGNEEGLLALSYYTPATVSTRFTAEHAGRYQVVLDLTANERYVDGIHDYNKCRLLFKVDGKELLRREFVRQEGRPSRFEFDRDWQAGPHELTLEVEPLTPGQAQVRSLALRIQTVTVRGPLAPEHWTKPPTYARFFPRDVPEGREERRQYARELLARFATKAFRRPVDDATADRLAAMAASITERGKTTFEAGVAQAMAAVLASPRFLFREEGLEAGSSDRYPPVDEYALASRLSYFFWSSMPDEELTRLAGAHKLRENLPAQFNRMLADPRSGEFVRNFVGQWLQTRDLDSVVVNAIAVLSRDDKPDPEQALRRAKFRELSRKAPESLTPEELTLVRQGREEFGRSFRRFKDFELDGELRRAMRRETEMLFEHVLRNDKSLLELLDCNYTFLNERLARFYGMPPLKGDEMRLVTLPPGSPRGGVLTQATVLVVTSNPDRTSPVKRGLFILDNILGSPPAPPPPDIPPLEEAGKKFAGRIPTLRETLELHRSQASCASCHSRMDPLGLSMENFNALGMFREKERDQPINGAGKLITGEPFNDVRELKRVLVKDRRTDYYRCLSEKMLTYALGRGLDSSDVLAVDELTSRLEKEGGKSTALLRGIVESAPFQRSRRPSATETAKPIARAAAEPAESRNRP